MIYIENDDFIGLHHGEICIKNNDNIVIIEGKHKILKHVKPIFETLKLLSFDAEKEIALIILTSETRYKIPQLPNYSLSLEELITLKINVSEFYETEKNVEYHALIDVAKKMCINIYPYYVPKQFIWDDNEEKVN